MLLVEHDMNAVFALADRISVLTYGRILASGAPHADRPQGCRRISRRGNGIAMLSVERLAASYGPAQVLTDISFSVGNGEVVTLIGRNGMGKTTAIFALMGLLPPESGTATFDGLSLVGLPPFRIAQAESGLFPKDARSFLP